MMQQKTGLGILEKKMKNKIFNISKLSKIIKKKKQSGSKIVLCHGVFDLVHYGHIAHFKNSKKFGDILVVTITADKFINKGPNRPYFNQDLRKKFLSNFDFIDYVSEVNSPSAIEAIRQIKPDFYSKGKEYQDINKDITKNTESDNWERSDVRSGILHKRNEDTVIGFYGEVRNSDLVLLSNVIDALTIVIPDLRITYSNDHSQVNLPIHIHPCTKEVDYQLGCKDEYSGAYFGSDWIFIDDNN